MGCEELVVVSSEVTHRPAGAQINLATEPILWQVERLCALIAKQKN